MGNRTYSPEFKLQVVLEALQSEGTDAEVVPQVPRKSP
jgi:transposase-like protein